MLSEKKKYTECKINRYDVKEKIFIVQTIDIFFVQPSLADMSDYQTGPSFDEQSPIIE